MRAVRYDGFGGTAVLHVDEVVALGEGVDEVGLGDEVIGWTDERAAQAEYLIVTVGHLTPRPAEVSWEVAGSLHVVGATAWAGCAPST